MKVNNKRLVLVAFAILITISSFINSEFGKNLINDNNFTFTEDNDTKLKSTAFWNLQYTINIDNNWSDTRDTYDWCSGSGTWNDPYKIENITMDAKGKKYGILIKNSIDYFKIVNCTVSNSGYVGSWWGGITLSNVNNGTIIGNNCSFNEYGISLIGYNNTIEQNILINDTVGIQLSYSNNNTIHQNYIKDCDNGIGIDMAIVNTIFSQNIFDNNGFSFSLPFVNNTLSGNNFTNCGLSIPLLPSDMEYTVEEMISHKIDSSNLVNNKPLYYYTNKKGLKPINFTNAGQVILVNCSNSLISGINTSNGNMGISLHYCKNNTLSNVSTNFNSYIGILLENSENNTIRECSVIHNNYYGIVISKQHTNPSYINNIIFNNTVNFNKKYGIYLDENENNILSNNNISNNEQYGISFSLYTNSINITISENNISNSDYGIYLFDKDKNTNISKNLMKNCGIWLQTSSFDLEEISTINIDESNKVNGKPVKFFVNETYLKPVNFSNAGQIILVNSNHSIISQVNISYTSCGISLIYGSSNNTIINNNISYITGKGIHIDTYCYNNSILENKLYNNAEYGLSIYMSNNNTVSGNNITKGGIYLYRCYYNNLTENLMVQCGVLIEIYSLNEISTHNIDTTNQVNGKTLFFYLNELRLGSSNFSNAGQVILVNCNDSIITGVNGSNGSRGISLYYCKNNTLSNNDANYNTYDGIYLYKSNENNISGNQLNNNKKYGIILYSSSSYNDILENNISDNQMIGIFIIYGYNNSVSKNNITDNKDIGIRLYSETGNSTIFINTFIGNGLNAKDDTYYQNNYWDNGNCGNYWEDYTGNDIDPQDGIGDSPYNIWGYGKRKDNKPLFYSIYEDTDGDGLLNYEEYTLGNDGVRTNVTEPDSDYDGLNDYWEWIYNTEAWNPDSDNDGMPDGWEVFNLLNPLYDLDNLTDADDDLLLNLYEYRNGTNPQNPDSDFDNMPDGWEVFNSLNANFNDAIEDPDNDRVKNLYEYTNGTNPQNPDTDGDGYSDWYEILLDTNALNSSTFPKPDLSLYNITISNNNLTIIIKNIGIWNVSNVVLYVTIPSIPLTLYNNSLNPFNLSVNKEISIVINLLEYNQWLDEDTNYYLNIIIDPIDEIDEINETNNLMTNYEFTIKDISPWEFPIELFLLILVIVIGSISLLSIVSYHFYSQKRKRRTPKEIEVDKGSKIFGKEALTSEEIQEPLEKIIPPIPIDTIKIQKVEKYKIFLCYSTLDSDYFKIQEIAKSLQNFPKIEKVLYWEEDSKENIVDYMEQALKASNAFIIFCSENSVNSESVKEEWHAAYQVMKKGKIKLISVYENEKSIPVLLIHLSKVLYNKENFNNFVEKLYDEILK